MSDTVIVGLLSLMGTVMGSGLGVLASQKLTQFRLEQLEKRVQAHNNLIERTYRLEGQMSQCRHEIEDLKAFHKPA